MIRAAQWADPQDRCELVKRAEPRVYTYIYRMTLNRELSEDLCQETLLMLVKSLPVLEIEHISQFWGWLYRTALTRIQRHFRVHGNRRIKLTMVGDNQALGSASDEKPSALERLMHAEAHHAVMQALSELRLRYRSVLTLRCLDQLSYPEIAAIMGGSEMQVRLWFYRAKRSLRRQLHQQGFTKDCLLPALVTFAYLTASEAQKASAATVATATSLETTWSTAFVATLTSRTAMLVTCLILGVALLVPAVGQGPDAAPANNPALAPTPPVPRLSNNLNRIFDTVPVASEYTRLAQISRTFDPNGRVWQYASFNWPDLGPAQSFEPVTDHPDHAMIVLRQDSWIEYGLPSELVDHPEEEIAFFLVRWGQYPQVYVTDGDRRQRRILPTSCTGDYTKPGYQVLGFDLTSLELPFEIRGIRFVGRDSAGPYGGCVIANPAVYLEAARPAS